MTRPKVLFFDAAGTLFHVRESVADVYLTHAERYGVKRSEELLNRIQAAFIRAFHDAPPPVFAATDPQEIKRCERLWWFDVVHNVFYRVGMFDHFDDYFEDVFQAFAGPAYWTLFPETRGVLSHLKAEGFELGIVSNFDTRLFTILRGLDIEGLFATVTISSLAHAAKPSPRIFHAALEKHLVDPEEAWHVGDSLRDDIEGARKAGVHAVLLDRQGKHAADVAAQTQELPVISTLLDLTGLLRLRRP
jgi:putative hydrolase of the HAD superfamily